ncbi:hypothetical protein EV426DRAFT_73269 [Tirmania nivea]|nr:hypothetical protein EV426DRAFT_73269 [Tirmania nivea]
MYTLNERDLGEGVYGSLLQKRHYDCDGYGNCRETSWSSWGRWIALVILLMAAFIFFFLCALISARRRRVRGQPPIWGTAWVPGTNPNLNDNHLTKPNQWQYDPNASTHQPGEPNPPPVYSPPDNYYPPPPGPPPQQYEMQSPYFYGGPAPAQNSPPQGPPPGHQETGTYFPPPSSPPPAHLQGGGKA